MLIGILMLICGILAVFFGCLAIKEEEIGYVILFVMFLAFTIILIVKSNVII